MAGASGPFETIFSSINQFQQEQLQEQLGEKPKAAKPKVINKPLKAFYFERLIGL